MSLRLSWWHGALLGLALSALSVVPGRGDATGSVTSPALASAPSASDLLEKATSDETDGKLDLALHEVTSALDLDAKNTAALDLRGTIYMQQRLWDRAERDYTTANQIRPDPAFQYKLGQIQYLQRNFDDARPIYAALKDDPRLGDLARFKVLVCDLFGSHQDIAARDLSLMDATGQKPSAYLGRATWIWFQGDGAGSARLRAQAMGRFGKDLFDLYWDDVASASHYFRAGAATFTTKDGRHFEGAGIFLENDGLRTSTPSGWVTIPFDQLPDDLSPFPADTRVGLELQRDAVIPPTPARAKLTFTGKNGKSYRQVRWNLGSDGLVVLTDNGWEAVPFGDLPDDLSSFPPALQASIKKLRAGAEGGATESATVSFTTRRGKAYDSVRAFLGDDGVAVLTADGWTTVPFAELPEKLSPFPAAWRKEISSRQMSIEARNSNTAVVSFTTQGGAVYHDVRAALSPDGVMVVTPDGWRTIAFTDLPGDLSPFPSAWCPVIQSSLQGTSDDASHVQVISFATRRGKSYDQVRATLDDNGLDVLGPNGWVIVSYDQLPEDLSAFPEAWRASIAAREKGGSKNSAAVHR